MATDHTSGEDPLQTSHREGANGAAEKADERNSADSSFGDENTQGAEQTTEADKVGFIPGPTPAEFQEIVHQYDDLPNDQLDGGYPHDVNLRVGSETDPGDLGSDWIPRSVSEISRSTKCEQVARQIQEQIGGEVHRIESPPFVKNLGIYRDQPTEWSFHDVVIRNGRVYDGFTERTGLPTDEYKSLWTSMYPNEFQF